MKDISKECELSISYHNHSIRAMGITVLTHQDFTNSEIMSISGHKSVQSLSIYQKTAPKQKMEMGNILFQSVAKPEDEIKRPNKQKEIEAPEMKCQLPAPTPCPALPAISQDGRSNMTEGKENTYNEIIPFEANFDDEDTVSDVDLLSALCNFEENCTSNTPSKNPHINSVQIPVNTPACTTNTNVLNNVPKSLFVNCNVTIGSINFYTKPN